MRRFVLIATAAVATLAALPAAANTARTVPARATIVRTAMDGSTICLRSADSRGCADYQAQLLRTVGQKAGATGDISVKDLGRRQLDALIASIN